VDAVTSDGAKTNRKMWEEFGLDGGERLNFVDHLAKMADESTGDNRRLYFCSDYVHLFKCIRNNLLARGEFVVSSFLNSLFTI
jgi:hypothetical protein